MSILAGYLSRIGHLNTNDTIERVKKYSILKEDDFEEYNNSITKINFGHIIQKYKADYPIQNQPYQDEGGNFIALLGYLKQNSVNNNFNEILEICKQDISYLANKLEGEFVLIYNDGKTGKIHIINDRFASSPFYIYHSGNIVYFSSNLNFLHHFSKNNFSIDILGSLQLFAHGRTVASRTIFKDVKRLNAATHLIISRESIEEKRYWRLKYDPADKIEPDNYCHEVYDTFRKGGAYRANLANKGVVALSGGLDSRLVAGSIPNEALFDMFTFVDSTDNIQTVEVKVATEVSRILGRKHHVGMIPKQFISNKAGDIIKLTGGMVPLHHSAKVLSMINQIRAKDFNYLLGGGPGDVIAGDIIPSVQYLNPAQKKECISDFFYDKSIGGKNLKSNLSLIFREDIINQFYSKIKEALWETFEKEPGETAAHMVIAWFVNTGMPSTIFMSPIHSHPDITETFCHIDYTFCDLMYNLPLTLHYKRNFYNYMIYNCLPELQSVIYANTGKKLSGEFINYDMSHKLKLDGSIKGKIYTLLKKSETLKNMVADIKKLKRIKVIKQNKSILQNKNEALFHYFLLQEDKALFKDLIDILNSYEELSYILDIKRCIRFLNRYKNRIQQSNSYHCDSEILGSLASLCYSFKYLKM